MSANKLPTETNHACSDPGRCVPADAGADRASGEQARPDSLAAFLTDTVRAQAKLYRDMHYESWADSVDAKTPPSEPQPVITYSQRRGRRFSTRYTAWIQFADGRHEHDADYNRAALVARVEAKYGVKGVK